MASGTFEMASNPEQGMIDLCERTLLDLRCANLEIHRLSLALANAEHKLAVLQLHHDRWRELYGREIRNRV